MEIKHNLRLLRLRQHHSQADLDLLCGFAKGTVAHYENGRRKPGMTNLGKLMEALDCLLEELKE